MTEINEHIIRSQSHTLWCIISVGYCVHRWSECTITGSVWSSATAGTAQTIPRFGRILWYKKASVEGLYGLMITETVNAQKQYFINTFKKLFT